MASARAAALPALPALPAQSALPATLAQPAWVQPRAQLLALPLEVATAQTRRDKGLIGLGLGLAGITGSIAIFSGSEQPASARRAQGVAAGLLALGEVAAIAGPEESSLRFQSAGMNAWVAGFYGLWLADSSHAPKLSMVGLAGGYFSSSALSLIDALGSQRTPNSLLAADLSRVSSPSERASLTAQDIAQFERDLHGSRGLIPRALLPLPAVLGSLVAAAPALDRSLGKQARRDAALLGTIGVLQSAVPLMLSCFDPIAAYDRAAARIRTSFDVQVAPGVAFLSFAGSF